MFTPPRTRRVLFVLQGAGGLLEGRDRAGGGKGPGQLAWLGFSSVC